MTYLCGECSCRRAEEEEETQRWSIACSQEPPASLMSSLKVSKSCVCAIL
jgi:hypothetical protein